MSKVSEIPCQQCGRVFQFYWLRDGVCNGCRNPHLIVEAWPSRGRYPRATRHLTDAEYAEVDSLFHRLNRMARTDADWDVVEGRIDALLYGDA